MPIKLKNIRLLFFGVIFFYLAGAYFGGVLMTLFYFALFFPLLSIILGLLSFPTLKYHQVFETEHPVKGQEVSYRLALSNEGFLPISNLYCRFKVINSFLSLTMSDFSTYLKAKGEVNRDYTFRCAYRGIYTVGLDRIEIEDPLKLVTLSPKVDYRTFYVYPRILTFRRFPVVIPNTTGSGSGMAKGRDPDYSLYTELKNYRDGESTRHMHWKKFAATGRPFLKQFETAADPEMMIYFDLRTCPREGIARLEVEDTSIEILVALVYYFLENNIPIKVTAPGRDLYEFSGIASSQFDSFYHSTSRLIFQDTISTAGLYLSDTKLGSLEENSILFITHTMDPDILNLVEDSLARENIFTLILNMVGYSPQERDTNLAYVNRLRERGARILVVTNPESIIEDLEGWQSETSG